MAESRKAKLSISISKDLLAEIDREAKQTGEPRSGVIESWLQSAARGAREAALAAEVIAYYDSRTAEERREDERMTRALSAMAKRVHYDDAPSRGRGKSRRRRT